MPGVSLKATVCNFQKRKARGRASREDPEGPAQFGCQTSFCTLGPHVNNFLDKIQMIAQNPPPSAQIAMRQLQSLRKCEHRLLCRSDLPR